MIITPSSACERWLLSTLLILQGLVFSSASAAALPLESPLQRVFHDNLFTQHGISSDDSARLAQSHWVRALRDAANSPIPFLGCGPVEPEPAPQHSSVGAGVGGMELRARALLGAGRVHVARDLHSLREGCLLVHAAPADVLALTSR